jgi:hypothetical protein
VQYKSTLCIAVQSRFRSEKFGASMGAIVADGRRGAASAISSLREIRRWQAKITPADTATVRFIRRSAPDKPTPIPCHFAISSFTRGGNARATLQLPGDPVRCSRAGWPPKKPEIATFWNVSILGYRKRCVKSRTPTCGAQIPFSRDGCKNVGINEITSRCFLHHMESAAAMAGPAHARLVRSNRGERRGSQPGVLKKRPGVSLAFKSHGRKIGPGRSEAPPKQMRFRSKNRAAAASLRRTVSMALRHSCG